MKQIIKKVLDRHTNSQANMASDSFGDNSSIKNEELSIEMWKGYQESFKDVTGNQLELDI